MYLRIPKGFSCTLCILTGPLNKYNILSRLPDKKGGMNLPPQTVEKVQPMLGFFHYL